MNNINTIIKESKIILDQLDKQDKKVKNELDMESEALIVNEV